METLTITAASLVSPYASQPKQLLQHIRHTKPINGVDSQNIPSLSEQDLVNRTQECISSALMPLVKHIPPNVEPNRLMIYHITPSNTASRAKDINPETLWDKIQWINPYFIDSAKFFGDESLNMFEHLLLCMDLLLDDEFDAVIFGAVDSTTDKPAKAEYQMQLNSYIKQTSMCFAEGGAYILLEKTSEIAGRVGANILSISANERTDENLTDKMFYKDMEHHIWQVLSSAKLNIEHINSVMLSGNYGIEFEQQWRKLYRYFWPKTQAVIEKNIFAINAEQTKTNNNALNFPQIIQPEVTECLPTAGYYGAVNFPMFLALAFARLMDRTTPIENMLYCHTPPELDVGVICLSRSLI